MNKKFVNSTFCKALVSIIVLSVLVIIMVVISEAYKNPAYDNSKNESSNINSEISKDEHVNGLYHDGYWYDEKEGLSTWLFLGLDKYQDELVGNIDNSNTQSDFLILFIFDSKNKTYQSVHINRDSMVDIDVLSFDGTEIVGDVYAQLTLAHTYGVDEDDAAKNTMRAVSRLLYDVPVENYISFTLDFIPLLNDLVGGVELEMLYDFSDFYPEMKKGSTVKLTGEQALRYVQQRVNVGEQTNLERMERQAQYMSELENLIRKKREEDDVFYLKLLSEISNYIYTNSLPYILNKVIDDYSSYSNAGYYTLEGEAVVGEKFMEFYPDEEKLQKLILDLFYIKDEG